MNGKKALFVAVFALPERYVGDLLQEQQNRTIRVRRGYRVSGCPVQRISPTPLTVVLDGGRSRQQTTPGNI